MAINPLLTYPGQVDGTDAAYPHGKAQNESALGARDGTPLEKSWVSDQWGFDQALLAAAGIAQSNVPDKVGASQRLTAIQSLIATVSTALQVGLQALNWPERVSVASGAALNSDVPIAWLPGGGYQGSSTICAMGSNTNPYTSEDGSLFAARSSFGGTLGSAAVDIAPGIVSGAVAFLASGSAGAQLIQSTDGGVTWALVSNTGGPAASAVLCYAASLGLWVAAGAGGAVHTSADGVHWASSTPPAAWLLNSGGAKRVVWNGSLFVILPLNTYGKFLTSTDGSTWTERTVPGGTWSGLAYSATDGLWMACASGTGLIVKSVDGLTWTNLGVSFGFTLNDLAVNNSLWIAANSSGLFGGISYSTNKGATWHALAVGNHRVATDGFARVLFADSRFIAVHATGTALEFALSQRSP